MKLAIIVFTSALISYRSTAFTTDASPAPLATPPPPSPFQTWNHILALSYGYGLQASRGNQFKTQLPPKNPSISLHGLWPNDIPTSAPLRKPITSSKSTFCYASSLSAADVQTLRGRLDSKWPNLYNYDDPTSTLKFWEREWVKHGTCSKFTKIQYFQKALDLFDLLNLSSIVKFGRALAPDNQKTYSVNDVLQAFNMHQPYLVCGPGGSRGTVLTDLYFCLDSQASSFVNCSTFYTNSNSNCNGRFNFKILDS